MKNKKVKIVAIWILQIILGLLFIAAGAGKLVASHVWIEKFNNWGYPENFYLLIGAAEGFGALLLFIPKIARHAAFLLAIIMIGAIITHIFHQEFAEIFRPAIFLVLLSTLIFLKAKI